MQWTYHRAFECRKLFCNGIWMTVMLFNMQYDAVWVYAIARRVVQVLICLALSFFKKY